MSLEESEKLDLIGHTHTNNFHLVKKIVQIGPVDSKIALLKLKKGKKETMEGKIYSPVGRFAERAKNRSIRIFTDILWRVFNILTEPVPCTFVSVVTTR